jgi:maleate isomerase
MDEPTSGLTGMDRNPLRVGVLTPHAAAGPEVELPGMAPGRVTTVVARVRPPGADASWTPPSAASGLRALAAASTVDRAAAPLRTGSVEVVAFASTTSGYALGHRAEAELVHGLAQSCGVPVVASSSAAVAALRACGSGRVLLVHPPWFDDEVDALGSRYFRDQGFEVSLSKASGLPKDPGAVRPGQVVDWVLRHAGDEAGPVFLAGNGFRAAGAIEELERRTGRVILTANQVLLWSILAVTGTSWTLTGYGRLLRDVRSPSGRSRTPAISPEPPECAHAGIPSRPRPST